MLKESTNIKRGSQFKRFLVKSGIFILILFVADFSIGHLMRYFYFKQKSGLQYRTTYAIEKTSEDVLVLGSSRANHHYQPGAFEKELGLSFYNCGRDGNFLLYHNAILKAVLKRYKPKIVILDFIYADFHKNQESYDRLSSLLPYYKNHPEIRSIIELKSKFEKYKLLSSIYPYNSALFTIAAGNTNINIKRQKDIQGYIPLFNTWNKPIEAQHFDEKYDLDSNKVNAYLSIIDECARAGIKLYIVCSPYFVISDHPEYSTVVAKEIANNHQVNFWDYSADTAFINHADYFANWTHLNDKGAEKFSALIAEKIKNTIH